MSYRNIAIIAHVDHGKTTLVDALLKQSGTFKGHESVETCVMDSDDQEKERGITIYAKNTSIQYKDCKINIMDTPGHADFGSEVERVLKMVDCVCLLVDAYEGPMPQTKFVLKKSLELGLKPIVIINKIDKPAARPDEVHDMVFDLFAQLGASDEQLEFPMIYAIGKDGIAIKNLDDEKKDITPLFDLIMDVVPEAGNNTDAKLKMQVINLEYDNFLGRMGLGRVYEGKVKTGQTVTVIGNDGKSRTGKISKIYTTLGLNRKAEVQEGVAGDVITIAGIPDIFVGETICEDVDQEPLPPITIDEATLSMDFLPNDSPFAGKEGKFLTSRNIRDRLEKELETNVGLHVEFGGENAFTVYGRGELHLSVLIETMRREGFELQVGAPKVVFKTDENGNVTEPMENVVVNVPEEFSGAVIEKLGKRKGEMTNMVTDNGIVSMEFTVPSRGLLGYKNVFTVDTKGEGILASSFSHYGDYKGEIAKRDVGSMISGETGKTMAYSLFGLQDRGPLFVEAATEVYIGMIIGEHLKGNDLVVNATKNKKLTNVRASGTDEALKLTSPHLMSLEEALDYIGPDEYVEITPKNIRIRKIYLTENERKKHVRK
ncbi:translational GTPase TypA [Candidatus Gracilibacteria bacterium]|nr:translational GTPase TypA [Candidatus Gracilibacteria bacterium]